MLFSSFRNGSYKRESSLVGVQLGVSFCALQHKLWVVKNCLKQVEYNQYKQVEYNECRFYIWKMWT